MTQWVTTKPENVAFLKEWVVLPAKVGIQVNLNLRSPPCRIKPGMTEKQTTQKLNFPRPSFYFSPSAASSFG